MKMKFLGIVETSKVLVLASIFFRGSWGASDPCFSNQVLQGDDRSAAIHEEFAYKCDDCLNKGWYRFVSKGIPMEMATERVSVNRCGTYASVWLNRQHPSSDQGIVIGRTCANIANLTMECPWPWTIRIKNCGEFYIYELIPTPYCPMRYCTVRKALQASPADTALLEGAS